MFIAAGRLRAALLGSVALLGAPIAAVAQPSPSAPAVDQAPQPTVSEVVVTAQRREERLLSVPAPVTALTSPAIERVQATDLQDYLKQAPGADFIVTRPGQTQIILRGITTGPQPNSTVATYIDETPYGSATVYASGATLTPDLDPTDIQRIEILRGPQGTLYGASALGGVVKFVTTDPDTNRFSGRVEAGGTTVDHGGDGYTVRGSVNVPIITDQLAVRASLFRRTDPGYVDNVALGRTDVNETRTEGGRISALWKPIEHFTLMGEALFEDLKSYGAPTIDTDVNLRPLEGEYAQRRFVPERLDNRYRQYSVTADYDLPFATVTSNTAYATLNSGQTIDETTALAGPLGGFIPLLGLPAGFRAVDFGVEQPRGITDKRFTQELRIASPTGPGRLIDWQAGFYFTHERSDQTQGFYPFDTTTDVRQPSTLLARLLLVENYTEYAGFGDVTYHFTDKLQLQGGVRYSHNEQRFEQAGAGLLVANATVHGASDDDVATFLVTPSYQLTSDTLLYVRIASGYRPGGPNVGVAGAPPQFNADTLTNYEAGVKTSLLDKKLTLDASGFYIDWSDVQLLTSFATAVGNIVAEGNGGGARSAGVEGAVTYAPFQGLSVRANAAYTNAELTQDVPALHAVDGDRLPYVPRFSGGIDVDYDWVHGDFRPFVGGGFHYFGRRDTEFLSNTANNALRPVLPGYGALDLRAGVGYRGWEAVAYVKNAGDRRGVTEATSQTISAVGPPFAASLIQPRTFGVTLSDRF